MGFLISALCLILFVHGSLQCYQAQLEFSDQGLGDIENTYHEITNADDNNNIEFFRRPLEDDGKDTNSVEMGIEDDKMVVNGKEETPETHGDSEETRKSRLYRNAEKRRMLKKDRMRSKHHQRLNYQNKGSDMLENPTEEEPADHDHETAHYYMSKPSDIANMSAMLGPGPVSIQVIDPTTQKPIASSSAIGPITKSGLVDMSNVANTSLVNDDLASFVDEHRVGNRRKFKLHKGGRKGYDAFMNWNDEFIPLNQIMKDGRMFQKHNLMLDDDESKENNKRTGHKKAKYKKMLNEALNIRKNNEKYHLNEEQEYANISVINKSFQNVASKKFDFQNNAIVPPDFEALLNKEEPSERARMVIDEISDEDARKLCLINDEQDISEDELIPLTDDGTDVEKKNGDINPRSNPRKGIKSKIEHGDWVYQVTLLPLPDYSIRRNMTKKKKLLSLGSQEKIPNDAFAEEKKYNSNKSKKNKKSVDSIKKYEGSLVKTSEVRGAPESDEVTSEYDSDVVFVKYGEKEKKRDERDTKSKVVRRNPKSPNEIGVFNRNTDTNGGKGDVIYDTNKKDDEQSYSSLKNVDANPFSNPDISDKAVDDYIYETCAGNEKTITTEACMENITTLETLSTCISSTETTCSTKPSRKPSKPKSSVRPNEKPDALLQIKNGLLPTLDFGQRNKTSEMFLSGQLADNFVDEVLRKVKSSRKISRELGYSNETEETCDRCIELKASRVPELSVMRNSLGRCSRSYASGQNRSECYGVPKPMERYLDVLVFYEKENENSFYSKIQDDSTFIFTGDYSESLLKGENRVKESDKYENEGSFNKETFDRQHLKEDIDEEKNEGKIASSDSSEKPKEKLNEDYYSGEDASSENIGKSKETQGEVKRNQRRFSKNKIDKNKEETFLDSNKNVRDVEFTSEINSRVSHPFVNEHSSNKVLDSNTYHREFGNNKNDVGDIRKEISQDPLNSPQGPKTNHLRNFDRFYGKSNYQYFKQYPSKNSPIKPHPVYKFDYGDSSKNALPKDSRTRYGFHELPNSNRMYTKEDGLKLKNNDFGYSSKKYNQDQKKNMNSYQPKLDFLYDDNGEYSLYPNLKGRSLDEDVARMSGSNKNGGGENLRMVKRDAETLYDDEQNVFFEIPDIEYDLYK